MCWTEIRRSLATLPISYNSDIINRVVILKMAKYRATKYLYKLMSPHFRIQKYKRSRVLISHLALRPEGDESPRRLNTNLFSYFFKLENM